MKSILTGHQQSALDIKNNIALTANAGSGKTFVLSKRFLEIALANNIPVRKIAAITFTEKAASELYKKIVQHVEDLIAETTDTAVTEKLQKIRRSLISANISTIHSFCINLLREYPVEAELDANFTPVDNSVSGELIELSISEVIKNALSTGEKSVPVKPLIRLFGSRKILSDEIFNIVANRKNILEQRALYARDVEEIAEHFYCSFIRFAENYLLSKVPELIRLLQNIVDDALSQKGANKTASDIVPLLRDLRNASGIEDILNKLSLLGPLVCTEKNTIRSALIKKIEVAQESIDFIEKFFYETKSFIIPENHNEIEKELAVFGKNVIYFFEEVLAKYEDKKRAKGYLDFEDILLLTKKLLEDENVRESVWKKFDYIMIDEYQDTNEVQYEIFLPILDHLKRGNLFVVGDEKQSIYMFRDAELEVFDKTKVDITNSAGRILMLPDSFRMGPEICLFTNYIFQRLFAYPDLLFNEVSHSDLVCARQDPSSSAEVEFLLEDPETEITESELIAKKLLQLKTENKIKWSDAAVLSRKRKSFDELEETFVKYNIPYLIMGGRNFYQRQSIYDIYSYFSFLLDNSNDGALAGILRSPFFNLSDSKLYEISLSKGNNFYLKLVNSEDESLKEIKNTLHEMILISRYKDAPELLRLMLRNSNYIAYLSARNNGIQETANIEKLINVTIKYFAQGFRTLYDYVNFLGSSIEETEDESQALIADDSNTVKIMTIHQSKGLEYPVVFLFKSGESAQKTVVKQKNIIINKMLGILTKVPLDNNYYESYLSAPVINLNNFISIKKNIAELKRLLYVGITRAKDSLYITSYKAEKYPEDSFMGLFRDALHADFSADITLAGNLQFLRKSDNSYSDIQEFRELIIPVKTDLESSNPPLDKSNLKEKKLYNEIIVDSVKDEIISATRFSVYTHCPLKYKFTYLDGLKNLLQMESFRDDENNEKDEELAAGNAGLKGSVIHKLLQEGDESPKASYITNLILREEPDCTTSKVLSEEILTDLNKYFASEIYQFIKNNKGTHHNEFEVCFRDNDYILYGIIDKLIIEENQISIIDYKTDNITEENISERAEEYLNQLKFYSYIVWNTFNRSFRILYKIIFIRHPDKNITREESVNELLATGDRVREMVNNIRNSEFNPEKSYCRKCIYSIDHVNCIKKVN